MELNNMLLNQLSNNGLVVDLNKNKNTISNSGFGNFLENAKHIANAKQNSNSAIKDKFSKNQDNVKTNNSINSNDKYSKKDVYSKENISKKEDIQNIEQDKTSKNIEESVDKEDTEESNEINKVIIFDEKVLSQLSDILDISSEKIMAVLSELGIPVSHLENSENLINFLQQAFELENPVELLSKDGIKDIMSKISNLAKSIEYNDLITDLKDIESIIDSFGLKDIKLVNLEGNSSKENIEALLNKLNGNVVEVNEDIASKSFTSNVNNLNKEEIINAENISIKDDSVEIKPKEHILKDFNQNNNNFSHNQNNNSFNKDLLDIKIEAFHVSEITQSSKVFNASLPKTQALKSINSTEVITQILEKMKTSVKPDMTEVKILLRPEHLGEVSLKIATQSGTIVAQFTAENQKVKEIIESNFNQLKDMLLEQGIDVGSLEVNVSDDNQKEFKQFENMQQKSSKRMEEIIEKSFEEEKEPKQEKVEVSNSQVDYAI